MEESEEEEEREEEEEEEEEERDSENVEKWRIGCRKEDKKKGYR
jgi:hypothetical protein